MADDHSLLPLPSLFFQGDAAAEYEKQFYSADKLRQIQDTDDNNAAAASDDNENAPPQADSEPENLAADDEDEDPLNHVLSKATRSINLPDDAIKESGKLFPAAAGSHQGRAAFAKRSMSLRVFMALHQNKQVRQLRLFIPKDAVDGSMRVGMFKHTHEIGVAVRGLYLIFCTLAELHTSVLCLPCNYGETNPTESSASADKLAANARPQVQIPGAPGGGGGGGAPQRAPPGVPTGVKPIPYQEYCSQLETFIPHQVCALESVFVCKNIVGANLDDDDDDGEAAAAISGRFASEAAVANAAAVAKREIQLRRASAAPNTNEVIGWDLTLSAVTTDSELARGLSVLCGHFCDVVSNRYMPKPSLQELLVRRAVEQLVETFKREHLPIDNIHSSLAFWLSRYSNYINGECKYTLSDLASRLNYNRPANAPSLDLALCEILSLENSIRFRLSTAYILHGQANNFGATVCHPSLVSDAQREEARKLLWYPQGRKFTYEVMADAEFTQALLVEAINPLPLDTSTASRLMTHYHMPNSGVDEATSMHSSGGKDLSRLLYENAHDAQSTSLHIDDSVRTARARWSWSQVEDKLQRSSTQESSDLAAAQSRVSRAKRVLQLASSESARNDASKELAEAKVELDNVYGARNRNKHQSLQEIMHVLSDTANGCTGAQRVSERLGIFNTMSIGHEYGNEHFRNGCNRYGLMDYRQSFFQNFIHRRMIQVDKFLKRVNSHIPFFKAEVVRTACYDLALGEMRSCVYLDGDAGAGKTALIELICESSISFDKVEYETNQSMTTEATDAMCIHAMSEITLKYAGVGDNGIVDPVMKEALSAGFVSVRTFQKDDKDPTRRLRATGAIFLVSMIAAGNFAFSAFPPEVRQRWIAVYVSSAQAHPEAPTHEMKDETMESDRVARAAVIREFQDENAWCALAKLTLQTGIGGYRMNLEIVNAMINSFNRTMMSEAHYVKLEARKKKQINRAIEHWSLVYAVHYVTNGPGALITGRYRERFDPAWVFDILEIATCPPEEVVWFVLSLYADEILDMRSTLMLSRVLKACGAPEPFDWDNLSVQNPNVGADRQPAYLVANNRVNYNYQKINISMPAALNLVHMACRDEFTLTEIRHVMWPETLVFGAGRPNQNSAVDKGLYTPNPTLFSVKAREDTGAYRTKDNALTGKKEHVYVQLPPLMVQSGTRGSDACLYVLTELHRDIHRELLLNTFRATTNIYTQPRPYTVALGIPYADKANNCAWPNAFSTYVVKAGTSVPRAYCPYGLDERTFHAMYKNIGETEFLIEVNERQSRGTLIEGELEFLAMKRHLERLYSPEEAATRPMYGYWKWQVEIQKRAVEFVPGVSEDDADGTMARLHAEFSCWEYTDTFDPETQLYDFGEWMASSIRASRSLYEQVVLESSNPISSDIEMVDAAEPIWKSRCESITASLADVSRRARGSMPATAAPAAPAAAAAAGKPDPSGASSKAPFIVDTSNLQAMLIKRKLIDADNRVSAAVAAKAVLEENARVRAELGRKGAETTAARQAENDRIQNDAERARQEELIRAQERVNEQRLQRERARLAHKSLSRSASAAAAGQIDDEAAADEFYSTQDFTSSGSTGKMPTPKRPRMPTVDDFEIRGQRSLATAHEYNSSRSAGMTTTTTTTTTTNHQTSAAPSNLGTLDALRILACPRVVKVAPRLTPVSSPPLHVVLAPLNAAERNQGILTQPRNRASSASAAAAAALPALPTDKPS